MRSSRGGSSTLSRCTTERRDETRDAPGLVDDGDEADGVGRAADRFATGPAGAVGARSHPEPLSAETL
jgi:hypothetical protein